MEFQLLFALSIRQVVFGEWVPNARGEPDSDTHPTLVCYAVRMRVVRSSTSHADAQSARAVLNGSGISAHIADEALWNAGELRGMAVIRVMVDNRSLERARRVLREWDVEVVARDA